MIKTHFEDWVAPSWRHYWLAIWSTVRRWGLSLWMVNLAPVPSYLFSVFPAVGRWMTCSAICSLHHDLGEGPQKSVCSADPGAEPLGQWAKQSCPLLKWLWSGVLWESCKPSQHSHCANSQSLSGFMTMTLCGMTRLNPTYLGGDIGGPHRYNVHFTDHLSLNSPLTTSFFFLLLTILTC